MSQLWPRSIRGRLVLVIAVAVSLALLLFDTTVYASFDRYLQDTATNRAREAVATITSGPDRRPPDLQKLANDLAHSIAGSDLRGGVFDATGAAVITRPNDPDTQLAAGIGPGATGATGASTTDHVVGALLVHSEPVPTRAGAAWVVVAVPYAEAQSLLAQLRSVLILGTIVAAILAGALVAISIRLAFRPLDKLAATAKAVSGGDLDARANITEPAEVATVAGALDQMLEAISEAFAAQRRVEAQLRQFVPDASHEMRTPLAAIGGYLDALLSGAGRSDADRRDVLRAARREVDRLARLAERLLTLAQLDEHRPILHESVDVALLCRESCETAMRAGPGALPVYEGPDAVPLGADGDLLRQMLINLIENARRHTPADGDIRVRVALVDGWCRVEVRDTGTGISPEHLPRIFDRFWRDDVARSSRTGGAGLGLSLVRGIVLAHHGVVSVESVPGAGTTVVVELPTAVTDPPAVSQAPLNSAG
ncbi:MAG: sensor histidine kinase [Candidatus Limnocylindria bacterium]